MVHPGFVTSASDGESHYLDAHQLANLYGLGWRGWVSCRAPDPHEHGQGKCGFGVDHEKVIHLYPRYDGKYVPDTGGKSNA